jgi:mono/diheme cytochrome c family protein
VRRLALLGLLALLALLAAGCGKTVPGGGRGVTTPTPEAVVGTVPSSGPAGNAAAGKTIYAAQGCGACHTFPPAGSTGKVGPNLVRLPADAKKANQGTLEQYTKSSIVAPGSYIVPGYPNAMPPTYGQKLSQQQVADLVAFLVKH